VLAAVRVRQVLRTSSTPRWSTTTTRSKPTVTDEAREAGSGHDSEPAREQVVIRDKRKIDASGRPKVADEPTDDAAAQAGAASPGAAQTDSSGSAESTASAESTGAAQVAEADEPAAAEKTTPGAGSKAGPPVPGLGAELEALRTELDERLRDLQRIGAEYANYRKRVERDRSAVVEQAMGMVISSLLPILDDIDRAREHDDLVGPFAAVAEQLAASLAKFGLTGFGEAGDAFDPTRHEAVSHETSSDVTEPTCVSVMRRGYLLGDRLLRAALVGVADPE
jgi:molecular chaperone GrpE